MSNFHKLRFVLLHGSLILLLVVAALPQQPATGNDRVDKEELALTDQVTLSADQISTILRAQPLLMLEVKKALVRKAYEQGRLLDPRELTDGTVLKLVQDDTNVQVIATQEIERSLYARNLYGLSALPSQARPNPASIPGSRQNPEIPNANDTDPSSVIDNPLSHPGQAAPEQTPNPSPAPRNAPSPQRQTEVADKDVPDSLDTSQMARVSPSDLSALLQGGGLSPASLKLGSPGIPAIPNAQGPIELPPSIDSEPSPTGNIAHHDRHPASNADSTDAKGAASTSIRHRPNPYADVPSLYDIYSQVSKQQPTLDRFAMSVFRNGSGNLDQLPMDLPVGADYVVGPGDGLNIQLTGAVAQRLTRNIDREGRISLPEFGMLLVAGKSMGQVQHDVQSALRTQFRDIQADVSLARLRTVRVYVVGDVQHPGAYDVSALSTPLNVLYAAGGPTQNGSLRMVKHFRAKQLVQQVDLYDLLLNGTRDEIKTLQPGDTILVPPTGPQVKVEGMVRRPAIYEINGEKNLAQVLELSGGVLATGTLRHIEVERVEAHSGRSMLSLDVPETNDQQKVEQALENFQVQDGDVVRISPILPYNSKTVYLDGHVFHPGKYPYRDGMKVTDLIRSYAELLPEPYISHAEIIRLAQPDFRPTVISFNLADAFSHPDQDLKLQPFDTIRVFGRFDFEDPPTVTVNGEVREPGVHRTNGATKLSDAIYLAGGPTRDAMLSDVQVIRRTDDGKVRVLSANLGMALKGDPADDLLLQPKDRVVVHRSVEKIDPPSVVVEGEVARPGKYALGGDMTAVQLVKMAGGIKRSAYTESASLTRYMVQDGQRVLGEQQDIPIGRALAGEADTDVRLRDGDVLTIGQISGWKAIGATVKIRGEIAHPGAYGIQEGERLSSVLRRAGGFRADAYPYGAVFERVEVRELAEKNRDQLIQQIENADVKVSPELVSHLNAAADKKKQMVLALKSQPVSGRMVVHISGDITKWEGSASDIVVRAGDELVIPKKPYFVMVNGQVYNASAVTYQPGKNAGWYLRQAGGPTMLADSKHIFIIRADGSVVGRDGNLLWGSSVTGEKLRPGDTVVVPERFVNGSSALKTFLQAAQVMSQIAFTAAVATR